MSHHEDQASVEAIAADPPLWAGPAVLRQEWCELAYFHWRYEPAVVQRLLPPGVTVDTFDGAAWVGLIPFEMRNVQLGRTPPLPLLSSFIEINVRTYVQDHHGRRGVWFFSLDVPRRAIVAVARVAFSLPYCWADASHERWGDRHHYRMTRKWPRTPASADMSFVVGDRLAPYQVGELDHFLTARWSLLTKRRGRLLHGRVDHQRWPLHNVDDVVIDQTAIEAAGLPSPEGAPRSLYSPGVNVRVAPFETVSTDSAEPN